MSEHKKEIAQLSLFSLNLRAEFARRLLESSCLVLEENTTWKDNFAKMFLVYARTRSNNCEENAWERVFRYEWSIAKTLSLSLSRSPFGRQVGSSLTGGRRGHRCFLGARATEHLCSVACSFKRRRRPATFRRHQPNILRETPCAITRVSNLRPFETDLLGHTVHREKKMTDLTKIVVIFGTNHIFRSRMCSNNIHVRLLSLK